MMKTKRKKCYSEPLCLIMQVSEATQLMNASVPGQHNSAENGGTFNTAKQAILLQTAEEEDESSNNYHYSVWD
nr:hypothetical protein [uncultured Prevotella sp.]